MAAAEAKETTRNMLRGISKIKCSESLSIRDNKLARENNRRDVLSDDS